VRPDAIAKRVITRLRVIREPHECPPRYKNIHLRQNVAI
jgi:hypothetical protein